MVRANTRLRSASYDGQAVSHILSSTPTKSRPHHFDPSAPSLPLPNPQASVPFSSVMANPTNVLSSGIEIIGSIRFSNDMIIDGKIEGEITSEKGRVTIGENALIKGDVTAGEVKVYGKVEGKITSQRCELKDKSRINGDIKSKVFSMEEGASLSGRTEIGG
jgi:cytoskeletal protein CcmA (bactofilin family)